MNTYRLQFGLKRLFGTTRDQWSRLTQPAEPESAAAERSRTDEGLRKERSRTDRALSSRQEAINGEADLVVRRARKKADAVLTSARDNLDQGPDAAVTPERQRAATTEQRQIADQAVQGERAIADEAIRQERAEAARVLAKLLPLERQATDRFLLTERVRSDGALVRRDGLLGIVAHDLRDLLGGMLMSTDVIANLGAKTTSAQPILEATGRLRRYTARMNRLVGDLVDIASIDAGKFSMKSATGDVSVLLAEAVETFRETATAKGLSLEVEAVEPCLSAAFDHDRMLQVLANGLSNAIKFTPAGGRITVRGERSGHELYFRISDTGPGIPADSLEAVFERFWQAGKNARTGLGLGLYLSRCIVEAHGGRIWVESTPEKGTSLFFTLPAWVLEERRQARNQ